MAELTAGVLAAPDADRRSRRLATLDAVADVELLGVDLAVATTWARLRVHLAEAGGRVGVNDLWIAATAVANDLAVITQDDDFAALVGVRGVRIVMV